MKYFFVLVIFAVIFSPVILGLNFNKELIGNADALEYAKRVDCGITPGPGCSNLNIQYE